MTISPLQSLAQGLKLGGTALSFGSGLAGSPGLAQGSAALGALGSAVSIPAILANPYMNSTQQGLAASGAAVNALYQGSQALGSTALSSIPGLQYLGPALGIASTLASNAPAEYKTGEAISQAAALAATPFLGPFAAVIPAFNLGGAFQEIFGGNFAQKRKNEMNFLRHRLPSVMQGIAGAATVDEIAAAVQAFNAGTNGPSLSFEPATGAISLNVGHLPENPTLQSQLSALVQQQMALIQAAASGNPLAGAVLTARKAQLGQIKDVREGVLGVQAALSGPTLVEGAYENIPLGGAAALQTVLQAAPDTLQGALAPLTGGDPRGSVWLDQVIAEAKKPRTFEVPPEVGVLQQTGGLPAPLDPRLSGILNQLTPPEYVPFLAYLDSRPDLSPQAALEQYRLEQYLATQG